ncbi:uncharacterized protein [Apostichopus japonicus]|uniref:uncharacterized protein n=1 Tax=Stichopus japonicus TaxID=307972 RepID=UPI003AB8D9DA
MKRKMLYQLFLLKVIIIGTVEAGRLCDFASKFPCKGDHCIPLTDEIKPTHETTEPSTRPTTEPQSTKSIKTTQETTELSTGITTELSTGIPTELSTGITTELSTGITTELSTGITTELTTGIPTELTTGIPTELSTGITTELSTGITTELSTGITTELSTGITTELSTGITTELQSTLFSSMFECPPNMIYGNCTCQATCQDPKGESACNVTCLGSEGCICQTDGYLLNGSDCIHESQCGCYVPEVNLVIPNGETFVIDECSRNCSCNNSRLLCDDDFSCGINAVCRIINGVRQCSCNDSYISYYCIHSSCQEIYDRGYKLDGVYTILPFTWEGSPFNVHCKIDNDGAWTVIQRRTNGNINFAQDWTSYKEGFGNNNNFWLGNEKLYTLTNELNYILRVDITTSNGTSLYAEFSGFRIDSENNNYTLNKLGSRSSGKGTVGNALYSNLGYQFSTFDRDNDACGHLNCAELHRSGWWHFDYSCSVCWNVTYCDTFHYDNNCYSTCTSENLNGVYDGGDGESIFSDFGEYCDIKFVEMKIRAPSELNDG